jgi:protein phosphatase
LPAVALGYSGLACGKDVSEDFFDAACPEPADLATRGIVLALADGMSGGGGRRAAETCVRAVLSDYYAAPAAWDVARRLDRIIGAVNGWLLAQNLRAADAPCMLSTLSVLVLNGTEFHVGHVGDCRIYRQRGRVLECLTTDHVWPRSDMRHVLRRAVGLDQHLVVDCFSDELQVGDRFFMLTDGVWEVLGDSGVSEAVNAQADPESSAQALAQRAAAKQRTYYGRNDATAAVVQILALPVQAHY